MTPLPAHPRIPAPRRRAIATLACLSALLPVAAASIALAAGGSAKPAAGAKYAGQIEGQSATAVSFRVSKNGKKVSGFHVSPFFPNACGAGGPPPKYTSKSAVIADGKFKATVMLVTDTGSKLPAGTVTGKFLAGKREKGTLTPLKLPAECTRSFAYATKVRTSHH